jgi:hypothetical protein
VLVSCGEWLNMTANSIALYSASWLVLSQSPMTLWALSLHSRLATYCCFWASNFAAGHHHLSAILDGRGMLERLLRMRQDHYLPCAELFESVPLSSWGTAATVMTLERYLLASFALWLSRWPKPGLSLSLVSCFAHDSFSHSRCSCSFVEL